VDVIARYTQTFLLLQRYDEGLLTEPKGSAGGALPFISAAPAGCRSSGFGKKGIFPSPVSF
jgi:hypothetical protein